MYLIKMSHFYKLEAEEENWTCPIVQTSGF